MQHYVQVNANASPKIARKPAANFRAQTISGPAEEPRGSKDLGGKKAKRVGTRLLGGVNQKFFEQSSNNNRVFQEQAADKEEDIPGEYE